VSAQRAAAQACLKRDFTWPLMELIPLGRSYEPRRLSLLISLVRVADCEMGTLDISLSSGVMFNLMVERSRDRLSDVFAAVADPTRRASLVWDSHCPAYRQQESQPENKRAFLAGNLYSLAPLATTAKNFY
jgi:hypothetical protein